MLKEDIDRGTGAYKCDQKKGAVRGPLFYVALFAHIASHEHDGKTFAGAAAWQKVPISIKASDEYRLA